MKHPSPYPKRLANIHPERWIYLLLAVATITAYWQVHNFDFINYDDPLYVTENKQVQSGISFKTIAWAFTDATKATQYWSPLTWLSFLIEFKVHGMNPGGYHITNVFLHLVNTLLLFYVLKRMTGMLWQSAFVAALFALHPLHVESVVWITERKDVLSTLFWMLALLAYTRYVERPGLLRYFAVILLFILGLMAKPMLVTFPFALLLLDYWPFNRYRPGPSAGLSVKNRNGLKAGRLVVEKVPLIIISGIVAVAAFLTQHAGGAVKSLASYPLSVRFSNSLVSYVNYIGKTIWPQSLAVIYPHPGELPVWQPVGAFLLLLFISGGVLRAVKTRPYLTIGWLWYLGTLVPVIGLVVIGPHAMADRYTYVPLIGLFIIIAWGLPELLTRWRYKTIGLGVMSAAVLSALLLATWIQVRYWQSSITLFERTIAVTRKNYVAYNNLGLAFAAKGRVAEAAGAYAEALRIEPDFIEAHLNLGGLLMDRGKIKAALNHFYDALKINPDFSGTHYSLGVALSAQGRKDEAVRHYFKALQLNPKDADVHNNLGLALLDQGKIKEAIFHFKKALILQPDNLNAQKNLEQVLNAQKKLQNEAIERVLDLIELNPNNPIPHINAANLYKDRGDLNRAADHYQKALALDPESADILTGLAIVRAIQGNYNQARTLLESALASSPDRWEPFYYMAAIFARQNRVAESIKWLSRSVKRGFDNWDLLKADQNLKNIRSSSYYKGLIQNRSIMFRK